MAPDQAQQGQESEVAKLFQNVGQGLVLIGQYVNQAAPDLQPAVEELMGSYEQLVGAVSQARQQGGRAPQGQPAPAEAGAAATQQAF